ncbi:hypothetical protein GGI43DRAFT_411333 [Trichoderma evansii]
MDRLHDSLWVTLGHFLDGERSNEALSQLALLLFQNSSRPLKEDVADPDQWYEAFSGANFRWEGLGIMFASWTFGATTLSENSNSEQRKQLGGNYNRRILMQTYKNSTTKCVDLCRSTSCNNTMMVFLLHVNSLTASVITGDTGAEFWRQHAEAVAMMTFLGLHTSQSNLLPEDCVSVQAKRKLFCAIFRTDMMLSTLTGRPPLLSSRLCSVPLPLDIDDISLLNSKTETKNHQLDKDGWNIEEKNHATAFTRATYIILKIRSEILEMVLQVPNLAGNYDFDEIRKREMDAILRFPIKLQLKSTDFNNPDVGGPALHAKLITRLEHLSNLFFIERLSYKGDGLYSAEILEISLEMISLTVMFWTQQNRLEGLQGDYEWLVLVYAGPAGGILCLELLRTTSNAANAPKTAKVTKSMIIKQLTLLTGFLEWIEPSTPGAHLCNSIRTVVERVIEQALNPAPKPLTTQQQEFDIAWDTSLPEDMNDFDFGLLDTFDWLKPLSTTI